MIRDLDRIIAIGRQHNIQRGETYLTPFGTGDNPAPRDGTHILVCWADRPFDKHWTFNQRPPTVAHWFGPPGLRGGGLYLSVHEGEPEHRLHPTHWMPLPPPPEKTE